MSNALYDEAPQNQREINSRLVAACRDMHNLVDSAKSNRGSSEKIKKLTSEIADYRKRSLEISSLWMDDERNDHYDILGREETCFMCQCANAALRTLYLEGILRREDLEKEGVTPGCAKQLQCREYDGEHRECCYDEQKAPACPNWNNPPGYFIPAKEKKEPSEPVKTESAPVETKAESDPFTKVTPYLDGTRTTGYINGEIMHEPIINAPRPFTAVTFLADGTKKTEYYNGDVTYDKPSKEELAAKDGA